MAACGAESGRASSPRPAPRHAASAPSSGGGGGGVRRGAGRRGPVRRRGERGAENPGGRGAEGESRGREGGPGEGARRLPASGWARGKRRDPRGAALGVAPRQGGVRGPGSAEVGRGPGWREAGGRGLAGTFPGLGSPRGLTAGQVPGHSHPQPRHSRLCQSHLKKRGGKLQRFRSCFG